MSREILNEDWYEYDNKKIRDNRDKSKFSCEEKWEVDYLVKKNFKNITHTKQKLKFAQTLSLVAKL